MKWAFLLLYLTFILSPVWAQQVPIPKGNYQDRVTVYEKPWRNSLEGIKDQVQMLVAANDQLNGTYQSLLQEQRQLLMAIDDKFKSNEALKAFIDSGGGGASQQVRMDELYGLLKDKHVQLEGQQRDADALHAKAQAIATRLEAKRMEISKRELYAGQQTKPAVNNAQAPVKDADAELLSLRKELEEARTKETVLENRFRAMTGRTGQAEVEQLRAQKEQLMIQKDQLLHQVSSGGVAGGNRGQMALMAARKADLETKIAGYEARIKTLKQGAAAYKSGGDNRTKHLVKAMVAQDNKNARLRTKISQLKEDIALLREHIGSLERRANFTRGHKY